jgi:hypothetical protein
VSVTTGQVIVVATEEAVSVTTEQVMTVTTEQAVTAGFFRVARLVLPELWPFRNVNQKLWKKVYRRLNSEEIHIEILGLEIML